MHITHDFFDEMEIETQYREEEGVELDRLEYIIQMSLIKLRRFLTCGGKREHERILVLETLRQAAFRKTQLLIDPSVLEEQAMLQFEMHYVLNSAIKDLGLVHYLHIEVLPQPSNELPLVLVSTAKRKTRTNNEFKCAQTMSGSIGPPPKARSYANSILEDYFLY